MENKQQQSDYLVNKTSFNRLKKSDMNTHKLVTVTSKSYNGRNTIYYFAFPQDSMTAHAMENYIRGMMRQYDDVDEYLIDYGRND